MWNSTQIMATIDGFWKYYIVSFRFDKGKELQQDKHSNN